MSDQTNNPVLAQWQAQQQQPISGMAAPSGVSLPLKMQTPGGSVRAYLHFNAEYAEPQALSALIEQLQALGVPLDVWQPKQAWGRGRGTFGRGGW